MKEKLRKKTINGHLGKKYIHKDGENKLVSIHEIEVFLNEGWNIGRITSEQGRENIRSAMRKRDYTYMKGRRKSTEHK